jgi:hypothetical protein
MEEQEKREGEDSVGKEGEKTAEMKENDMSKEEIITRKNG